MGTHPIFESDFDCLTDKKMEFLLLALGGGALALSRSKSLKQVDQMVSQASKAAGGKSVYQIMNESLTKRELAGGFKDKMDKAEASKILGVALDADDKLISQAHRSLMIANHPDKGGSPFIAEKVNEAKELMTGKAKSSMFD